MTVKEVFELRSQGRIEEAYDAIRTIYAEDKGPYACTAMYWTAVDVLKVRIGEARIDEAWKILQALSRLMPNVPDKQGWVQRSFEECQHLFQHAKNRDSLLRHGPLHLQTGIWGENLAAAFLREKGFVIVERDWHSSHRDIDLIARYREYIVFVEVKTRRNTDFGDPVMAVDYKKRRNLRLAINHYIKYKHIENAVRFDIVTIVGNPDCIEPVINHLEDVRIMEL